MSTFEARGVRLAYDDTGPADAVPVVFLHGWTADRHRWDHQFDHLAGQYRLIRLDLPGHGDSGRPREAPTMAGLADDVRTLLDGLGVGRFVAVGHSMGGMIALLLALDQPERVDRLVLVDSIGQMVYSRRRSLLIRASRLLPHRLFVAITLRRAFGPGFPRAAIARYVAQAQALPRRDVRDCYAAMRRFDVLDRAAEITRPVLLVHGHDDIQFPPAQAQRLAARLPASTVSIVDAGHEIPVEAPEALTHAVRCFVGDACSAGGS